MAAQRLLGLVMCVVGLVLLAEGARESDSFFSQFKQFFTGSPTDRAVWLSVGGMAAMVVGAVIAILPIKTPRD